MRVPLCFGFAAVLAVLLPRAVAADETAPPYEKILKIDVHSHIFEDAPEFDALFDALNFRTINICVPGGDGHLAEMHRIAEQLYRKRPDLYPFMSTFDVLGRDAPDYVAKVTAWLDETYRQGAVATKIWKEVGMQLKDRDGKFILPDDPRFDPIYEHIARRGKPLHAHLADLIDAWQPLQVVPGQYNYYVQNPEWHLYGKPGYPSHAAIIAARDNIMKKHPTLVVVGAHLGSLEHDLDAIAERLDRYPNFFIEVAARTRNLARHPSERVRALFLKYPDRIMYGVDASWKPYLQSTPPSPMQRQAHINRLQLQYRADYEYYAGSGEITYANRRVQALHLPRSVLEKFYHANAERIYKLKDAWAPKP